jgi:hypothetical protein
MHIYLIKDYVRVDGVTGEFIEKAFVDDFEKHDHEIEIHSAMNQYVSFQIVFQTDGEAILSSHVEFSDLQGGGTLKAEDTQIFIEWFHQTDGHYIPDALIPMSSGLEFRVPLDEAYLSSQRVGALWVDWFIPKETIPGVYAGSFRVRANETEKEFNLRIRVHSVSVPDKSRMTADLNAYADSISPEFPLLKANPDRYYDGSFFEMEKLFVTMAREHRSLFHNLGYRHSGQVTPSFAPELEGEGKHIRVKSWELFDRHFGPYLDGTAFHDSKRGMFPIEYLYLPFQLNWPASFVKWGKKGFRTEVRRILGEFIRHFEEKGWTETGFEIFLNHKKMYRFYPFTIDEIWYEHDEEPMDLYYDVIKDTYDTTPVKFLFRMDSSNHYGNHYHNKYADMCELWVVGEGMFSWFPESVKVMKEKGNTLWIYGGGVIGSLANDLLSLCTWPLHSFMAEIQGFTVWNSFGHAGKDYLTYPNAGEIIMYPGIHFGIEGPIPSIRLKLLRNVMQLGDVLMGTNGYDIESSSNANRIVRDIINKHYGFQNDGDWWKETPDFVNTPPRIWDFSAGGEVDKACHPRPHEGKSPRIIERINNEVLTYLGETGLFSTI